MKKVNFSCEIITPMFMAGADTHTLEIRPSEFKGMLRFWWRAIKAEDNIEELKKEEARIFGGTGKKEGKSKVRIKIRHQHPVNRGDNLQKDYRLEWRFDSKSNSLTGKHRGIGYLLYSTVLPNQQRSYIKPGFHFDLEISSLEEDSFKHALASLWVAIYLGGFGARARRGGGNITVYKVEGETYGIEFIPKGRTEVELMEWIRRNLKNIKSMSGGRKATSKYTNLSNSKILIFPPKDDWIDALNFIGEEFCNFRNNNKSDIWNIAVFGMPVMHNGFRIRMVPYEKKKRAGERLSSPIIIKVIKANSLFFPVIIKLSFKKTLEIGRENKSHNKWGKAKLSDIKRVEETKINEFLNLLKNKSKEINYGKL